nr:hypothetical protein [Tanacetum cinerariifolium]
PICSLGYRAAMIRLQAEAASTSHSPPLPSPFILSPTRSYAPSSGTPLLLPISASTSSPPLQLPSASRREDRLEVTLPPQKRLGITLGPGYEVGESSSAAAARPAGFLRADYGFVATTDREIMELHAADRMRQIVILELLRADHRRSTEIIGLRTALQGQVTALQGQLLEHAPHSLEYILDPIELEDHVPLHIPKHPEDLVPDEVASAPTPPLPPSFLSPRIPQLLPIPLHAPFTSRRAEIHEADTQPQKRLLLTAPRPGCEAEESSAAARQP